MSATWWCAGNLGRISFTAVVKCTLSTNGGFFWQLSMENDDDECSVVKGDIHRKSTNGCSFHCQYLIFRWWCLFQISRERSPEALRLFDPKKKPTAPPTALGRLSVPLNPILVAYILVAYNTYESYEWSLLSWLNHAINPLWFRLFDI